MKLFLLLLLIIMLAPWFIGQASSEAQCSNLSTTSTEGLGTFRTIVLGRNCNSTTSTSGLTAISNVLWTVTSTASSDTFQIYMSPAGVVVPYVDGDALKFRYGPNTAGSSAGVEVVVPTTGQVSTIQIEDTDVTANLNLTEPMTVNIDSNDVSLFISSSAALTVQGDLNTLDLIVDAPSTNLDLNLNSMSAEIKGSTDATIDANDVTLLIEGTLNSLTAELNTLDLSINGEGCDNISVDGNDVSCVNTTKTVNNVPSTSCTVATSVEVKYCTVWNGNSAEMLARPVISIASLLLTSFALLLW